jgi:anti-sigma factor RsiW
VNHPTDDLTALLDGELPPGQAAAVTRHLSGCPACRAERDRLAAGIAALRALPPAPEPSPHLATRLSARLAREGRPASGLLGWLAARRWKLAAPATAAAVAAAVVLFAVRTQRAEEAGIALHLDLLLDYEAVASLGDVESAEDAAVVAALDELLAKEGTP